MIFSEEVGIRKPDPKIFQLVARRLNVQPAEIVHVGDNLRMDVWGAKNAGLKAIHFSTQEGRDRIAESDPNSLVSLSRKLGNLEGTKIVPDNEIGSLAILMEAIEKLERG
jgi:putative hydrolase of the HAD superfamily